MFLIFLILAFFINAIAVALFSMVIRIGLVLSFEFLPSLLVLIILTSLEMLICSRICLILLVSYSILSFTSSFLHSGISKISTFLDLVLLSSISVMTESISLHSVAFSFWIDSLEFCFISVISVRIDINVSFKVFICVFISFIISIKLRYILSSAFSLDEHFVHSYLNLFFFSTFDSIIDISAQV
uniref:Uncharacterized protein n=1 Tax=Cacopsylla melanoneura TaxID=428564 RepID=A0A8D9B2W8_9HEMI